MKSIPLVIIALAIGSFHLSAQTQMFIHKIDGSTDSIQISQIKSISFKSASDAHLIGWWPLFEDSGKVVHDYSGVGHNGALSSGVAWSSAGLNLQGGNNAVDFADSTFRLIEGAWEVTVNIASGQHGWIVTKDNWGYADDGIISINENGMPAFYIDSKSLNATVTCVGSAAIPVNTDVTLLAEWGSAGMKLFVNGVLVATNSYTGPVLSPDRPLSLGEDIGSPQSFNGTVKELRVYNAYIK